MNKRLRTPIVIAGVLALLAVVATGVFAQNIVAPNKYAWGENVGWLNGQPDGITGPGVNVTSTDLTGYMWGENIGWVNMSCLTNATCGGVAGTWGVKRDGSGNLKGYAWSENAGWINFSCHTNFVTCPAPAGNWGVSIRPATGVFSGDAWGENIGWIEFSCPDLDANGKTSLGDVTLLALIWNQQSGAAGFDADTNGNGIKDGLDRDLDGNNKVSLGDVTVLALRWNRLCSRLVTVPL